MKTKEEKDVKKDEDAFSVFSEESKTLLQEHSRSLKPPRRFFPSQAPLFPFADKMVLKIDRKLTIIGVIFEIMELAGLLINTQLPWGTGVKGGLDKVFYTFLLPFFDETWATGGKVAWKALIGLFLFLSVAFFVVILIYVQKTRWIIPPVLSVVLRSAMHLLPGVLVIPLFSVLGSTGSCDRSYTYNYWDSSSCFSGLIGAFQILSYIGMLLFMAITYLSVAFCFQGTPSVPNLASRPRCIYHAAGVSAKIVLTLLFHFLIPMKETLPYAIVFLVVSIVLLLINAMLLPYFSMLMNQLRGLQWGLTSGIALTVVINIACADASPEYTGKWTSLIILIGCAVAGGVIGFFLPLFRRNSAYTRHLNLLSHHVVFAMDPPPFPAGLPAHDLVLSNYPRIEKALDMKVKNSGNMRSHKEQIEYSLLELDAYLTAVYVPDDVGTACRFLQGYVSNTQDGTPPTAMIRFASRIFTKGMVRFPENSQIRYEFGVFLGFFANKLRMSLTEMILLSRQKCYISIPLQYRIYHLTEDLKASLHIANARSLMVSSICSQLHREIVGAITSFWGALSCGSRSTEDLLKIVEYISQKRESCKEFYYATLENPTDAALLNYASFLQDVMLDEENAGKVRANVAERGNIRRKLRRLRTTQNLLASADAQTSDNGMALQMLLKETMRPHKSSDLEASMGQSTSVTKLQTFVNILFAVIILMAAGMVIFLCVYLALLGKSVDRIKTSLIRTTDFMYGVYLVGQISQYYTDSDYSSYVDSLKDSLSTVAGQLYNAHYALTMGNLATSYAAVSQFLNSQRVPYIVEGTLSIEGSYDRLVGELFDLGFTMVSTLQSISSSDAIQASDLSYVLMNSHLLAQAFNYSTNTYIGHRDYILTSNKWVVYILSSLSVLLLLISLALVLFFINRFEISKESIINLFFVIPKSYINELYQKSCENAVSLSKQEAPLAIVCSSDSDEDEERNEMTAEAISTATKEKRVSSPSPPLSASPSIQKDKENQKAKEDPLNPPHSSTDILPFTQSNIIIMEENEKKSVSANSTDFLQVDKARAIAPDVEKKNLVIDMDEGEDENLALGHDVLEVADDDSKERKEMFLRFFEAVNHYLMNSKLRLFILIVCVIFMIISLAMMYMLHTTSNEVRSSYDEEALFFSLMERYYLYFSQLTHFAQQYVFTGDLVHPQRYYEATLNTPIDELYKAGIYKFTNPETVQAVVNIVKVISSAEGRQTAAIWLASSTTAYAAKITADKEYIFSIINGIERTYDYSQLSSLLTQLFAPYDPVIPSTSIATTNTADAALSDANKMDAAKNLVSDDYYQDHRFLLVKYLEDYVSSQSTKNEHQIDQLNVYWIVALVFTCLSFILFLNVFRESVYHRRDVWVIMFITLSMLGMIAILVILGLMKAKIQSARKLSEFIEVFSLARNTTEINLYAAQGYALRVITYGYPSALSMWNDLFSVSLLHMLTQVLLESIDMNTANSGSSYNAALQMLSGFDNIENYMYYSSVAVQIALSMYPTLGIPSKLDGFSYNIVLEPDFQQSLYATSASISDLYSSTAADAVITSVATKTEKAISAIAGERSDYVVMPYFKSIQTVMSEVSKVVELRWDAVEHDLYVYPFVCLIFSSVITGFSILFTIYMGYIFCMEDALILQKQYVSKHQLVKLVLTGKSIFLRLVVPLLIIVVLYIALILTFAFLVSSDIDLSRDSKIVHSRLATTLDTVAAAQTLLYGHGSTSPSSPYTAMLKQNLAFSVKYAEDLFLGNNGSFQGILKSNSTAIVKFFGSGTYTYQQYKMRCEDTHVGTGYSILSFDTDLGTVPTDEKLALLFKYGVENVWFQYLVAFINMAGNYVSSQREALVVPITSTVETLVTRSREIFYSFYQADGATVVSLTVVAIILSVFLLVLTVVVLFFVFQPFLRRVSQEEDGARLLIRMIPSRIREEVPMLRDFFESEVVNEDLKLLSDACASVDTSLQVVIGEDDRILMATNEVMKIFMYTKEEVLGLNFEQILAPNCAKTMEDHRNHLGSTRLKVLVGKTIRSAGMRSDGVIFPMEIHVRDVLQMGPGGDNLYVARLRIVDAECQIQLTRRMYTMLSESSQHPIVVMDSTGIIVVCNNACEKLFGMEAKNLVGNHMSNLFSTKEEMGTFELNHYFNKISGTSDSYDTIKVIGRGENNMDIPLSVSLTSIVSDEKVVVYVVATLIDKSNHFRARQITAASRAAIASSPVPVILFDHAGKIINFSPAAEKSWGIPVEKALRLTVRDLFHKSDASRFSFSLGSNGDLRHFVGVTRVLVAQRSTGEVFIVEARMKEMKTEKGDEVVVCYFKDLSKEMDISRRNIMTQSAFDVCPIAIVVADSMGEVKGVNRAAEKMFGYRANIIEGQNVKILMPENIASQHDEFLSRYAKTGVTTVLNATRREYARRADGRLFVVEMTVIELEVDDLLGDTERRKVFVGYFRDLSEQQQMQRAGDVYDAIIQNCPTPIISREKSGSILSFNPAASKLFGYSANMVIGKNISMLIPESFASHRHSDVLHASEEREALVDSVSDLVARTANGTEIPVRIHIMELRRGVVSPIYVASVKDLSVKSRVQDECKLEQAFAGRYPRSIIVTSRSGVIKFLSEEASRAFGFPSPEAAINASLSSMLTADDRGESERLLSALLDVESPEFGIPKKIPCRRRNGVPFMANITSKKMEEAGTEGGEVANGVAVKKNVSIVLLLDNLTYEGLVSKSEEIQEELLHNFDYGTAKLDEKGVITVVNQTFLQEFGFSSKDDVIGKSFASLIPDDFGVQIAQQINACATAGIKGPAFSQKVEFQLARSDRTTVHLELILRSIDSEGEKMIFLAYLRNIDATFSDRNSRKLIRDMLQTSPIPALAVRYGWKKGAGLTGENGTITIANSSALQQFNYSSDELIGKNLQALLTPTGKGARSLTEQFSVASRGERKEDNEEDPLNPVLESNLSRPSTAGGRSTKSQALLSYTTYAVGVRKDRTSFPARVSMMEYFDGEHNHSSLFIFIDETTQLIKQQVNCFMGAAAESMYPLAIVCTNKNGEIVLFSEQAETMFGIKEKDVLEVSASVLVDAENCGEWITKMKDPDSSLRKQSLLLPRIIGKKKNGALLSLEVTMYEAEGGTGGDRLFVSLLRDTTDEQADNLAGKLSQVAMASFGIPFLVTSAAGMIELVNDALLNLLLYTREELLHNTIKVILFPDAARVCDEYAQRAEDGNTNTVACTKIKRKDGKEIPVELMIGVFRTHGKTSLYAFVSNLEDDVELMKECTFTEALASMEKMVVLYVELNGVIQDATMSAARLFNTTRDEGLIGLNISAIFPTLTDFSSFVEKHRHDSGTTVKGRSSTGETIFCAIAIKETSIKGDELSYALLLFEFGSESERQKQVLQTALTSLSSIGVVVSDKNRTILYVNEEICHQFNYSDPSELVGKNVLNLMTDEIAENQNRGLRDYSFREKEAGIFRPGQVSNVLGVTKDGNTVSLVLRYEEVDTPKGKEFYSFFSLVAQKQYKGERIAQTLVSLYPLPVMILSQSGKIIVCSPSAANILKIGKKSVGMQVSSIVQGWEELLRQGSYLKRLITTKEELLFRSTLISTGAALCTIHRP